jgi:hypothetical protein
MITFLLWSLFEIGKENDGFVINVGFTQAEIRAKISCCMVALRKIKFKIFI